MTFHLADDIVRGMEPGTLRNLGGVLIFVVWLYGTLVLGVTALFSAILSVRALCSLPRGQHR